MTNFKQYNLNALLEVLAAPVTRENRVPWFERYSYENAREGMLAVVARNTYGKAEQLAALGVKTFHVSVHGLDSRDNLVSQSWVFLVDVDLPEGANPFKDAQSKELGRLLAKASKTFDWEALEAKTAPQSKEERTYPAPDNEGFRFDYERYL